MMKAVGTLSAGHAREYFRKELTRGDYYSQNQRIPGHWQGIGAGMLGLAGDVQIDQFERILAGQNPNTGAALIKMSGHDGNGGVGKHAAGLELVFSAPKSFSIMAMVGSEARFLDMHEAAVKATLSAMEVYVKTRLHHTDQTLYVPTANMIAATFTHHTSRSAGPGQIPDPQVHTHVVIANMTQQADGQWRALADRRFFWQAQRFGSALYRFELARQVQGIGYRIEQTKEDGRWELKAKGLDRETILAMSKRRQNIEAAVAKFGWNKADAERFAKEHREAKQHHDEDDLVDEWRQQLGHVNFNGIRRHAAMNQAWQRLRSEPSFNPAEAIEHGIAHCLEREAIARPFDIATEALIHSMGKPGATYEAIEKQMDTRQERGQLIRTDRNGREYLTSRQMVATEVGNVAAIQETPSFARRVASDRRVAAWARDKGLYPDQATVARLTLTSDQWVTAIEGLAGSTKTYSVGAIREFAESRGWEVRGIAITTSATKALRQAGVQAKTIDSFLASQPEKTSRPRLYVIDESSLIDTFRARQLLETAKQQGIERIVLVGDQGQHAAINAGAPIRQFLANYMPVAKLTEIRRQQDPALKRVVELAAAQKADEALDILSKQGRIRQISDPKKRFEAIADDYVQRFEKRERTLVVSPANDERRELNRLIREKMVERGHVAPEGREHHILVRRDLTKAQLTRPRSYHEGDIIHFRRGSKLQGIEKNSYQAITKIGTKRLLLENGAEIKPGQFKGINVYVPERRTVAVGDQLQMREQDKGYKLANGEFVTVTGLDDKYVRLRTDQGKQIEMPAKRLRHVDLGYVTTSHMAQGATVDTVIAQMDASRGEGVVNVKQFYVTTSRERHDVQIYTNDAGALRQVITRNPEKAMAVDPTVKEVPKTQQQKDWEVRMEQLRKNLGLPQQPVIQPNQQPKIAPSIRP